MPVRTVSEWGGVHEWTVDAAKALIAAGHKVTFVGHGETFSERARRTGASFVDVDWDDWQPLVNRLSSLDSFDLIFSHAPAAREFGIAINKVLRIEHIVMIHGAYHDYMYRWADQVDALVAASPSLVHFVQRFGRVEPWKVSSLPNAAPSSAFELPLLSFAEKLEGNEGHIVTASRLAQDKVPQIEAVERALPVLREMLPEVKWTIDVYGDGPLSGYFARRYGNLVERTGNARYELHGWVEDQEVPQIMNRSFLTVTAGMAGMRALAAGCLCIGVGARSYVGLQYGKNLRAGLWSNFGDHGVQRFQPSDLASDLAIACNPQSYNAMVAQARSVVQNGNAQEIVDKMMLAKLHC